MEYLNPHIAKLPFPRNLVTLVLPDLYLAANLADFRRDATCIKGTGRLISNFLSLWLGDGRSYKKARVQVASEVTLEWPQYAPRTVPLDILLGYDTRFSPNRLLSDIGGTTSPVILRDPTASVFAGFVDKKVEAQARALESTEGLSVSFFYEPRFQYLEISKIRPNAQPVITLEDAVRKLHPGLAFQPSF